jgi:Leucine carboxyl methyltransferase
MPRTHDDSWDLANSVGVTATMVATSRALASQGPDALLDDPFADPLVRAVGLAPFLRILDSETSFEDDPWLNRKTRTEQIAVRTRFFDDFFASATDAGVRHLGERSIVVDYLTSQNWQVTARPTKELYAHNGFQFPADEVLAIFGEMSYVSATLR